MLRSSPLRQSLPRKQLRRLPPEPTATPVATQTPEPTAAPTPVPVSYTIKSGDTLLGICIRQYGSTARVSEICSLNGIGNPDDIRVGEKILLP